MQGLPDRASPRYERTNRTAITLMLDSFDLESDIHSSLSNRNSKCGYTHRVKNALKNHRPRLSGGMGRLGRDANLNVRVMDDW